MNEKTLRMYAELTQEISLCQDEDFKKLGKAILELANNYDKALKEIEKLKQENNFLKQIIGNNEKYSYGIRTGSDKE